MDGVGRVAVDGHDKGGAFAIDERLVLTAHHVVRTAGDAAISYRPIGRDEVDAIQVRPLPELDVAAIELADGVESLTAVWPRNGASWRSVSPPPGADPHLTGKIDSITVPIHNAASHDLEVVQLTVDQLLGSYRGYSGSAVLLDEDKVAALLVEQTMLRAKVIGPALATNVLYAVSVGLVAEELELSISVEEVRDDVAEASLVTAWCQWVDDEVRRVDPWLREDERYYAVFVRNDGSMPATQVVVTCFTTTDDGQDQAYDWYAPALPGERTHYILKEEAESFPPDGDPPDTEIEYTVGGRRWRRYDNGPVEPCPDA